MTGLTVKTQSDKGAKGHPALLRLLLLCVFALILPACLSINPTPTAVPPSPTLAPPTATFALPTTSPTPNPQPPTPDTVAAWQHATTAHFTFYYLPGTQAATDIELIKTTGEQAVTDAAVTLEVSPTAQVQVYLVNRVFWQGGASYTGNVLLLSYPDPSRDYIVSDLVTVFRHEVTHALVEQMLGSATNKGGLLGEGVAVWVAGGHYHKEALDVLASTLVTEDSDLYIPLTTLQTAFYDQQHEIAYLEGAALTQYLIEHYGLDKFKRLLAAPTAPTPIYGESWASLEREWRAVLAVTPRTAADVQAVRLRVRYYDAVRHYEETRDHDARLLPDQPPSQWDASLIAAFTHPTTDPANIALERELVTAGRALWNHDLATTVQILDQVDVALR